MAQVAGTRVVNGIATRVLHNKDYVEVSERTRILHELRKNGEIKEFEMVSSGPAEIAGQVYWQVAARIDGKLYMGSAEVKFDAPKNTPDGTNPISCAETSAFGRMLAFAGLGTVESIASYDEIMRAQPGTVVSERNDRRVVEAAKVPALPAAQPAKPEQSGALEAMYQRGKERGLWQKREEMFPFIAATLGVAVNRQTIYDLTQEQLESLVVAVDEAEASAA